MQKGEFIFALVGERTTHPVYGEAVVIERLPTKVKIRFIRTDYETYVGYANYRRLCFRDKLQKKKVLGIGINDANYRLQEKVTIGYNSKGKPLQRKVWTCPFYEKWFGMLRRCYSESQLLKDPQYTGCSVCSDWLTFSKFRAWMEAQNYEGMHLDKDLLGNGKEYSPSSCAFILQKTNKFMTDRGNCRGEFMIGVSRVKPTHRFSASINDGEGNSVYLGRFDTELEAHKTWQREKYKYACILAEQEIDPRVADALRQRYAPDKDWSKV